MEFWPLNLQRKTFLFVFQGSSLLQISDVDLCLSPAGAVGKNNLSSETYVKEDDCDTANMEDFGLKIPIIVETLEMDNGKTVSSIGSSNLAVSCAHFYQICLKLSSKIILRRSPRYIVTKQ